MGILLDLIIAVIIIVTVLNGYRKGLVESIIKFLAFTASFIAACSLSPFLKQFIYENYIRDRMYNFTSEKIAEIIGGHTESFNIGNLLNNPPDSFIKLLTQLSIDLDSVSRIWQDNIDSGVETANDAILHNIIDPISGALSMFFAFTIILIIAALLCALLSKLILKIVNLPVLRTVNKVAGLFLGIVFAYIYSSIAVMLINLLTPYSAFISGTDAIVTSATVLYRHISSFNLIEIILSAMNVNIR